MGRTQRHLSGAVVCASLFLTWRLVPSSLDLVSTATAYLSWVLLAAALAWGPVQVLRRRPNPTNSYTRRDLGIWAALFGLVHLAAGTGEAMSQSYLERYVDALGGPAEVALRQSIFGASASIGVLVGLVFLLLLMLSNDWSLRRLGARWWKRLQRVSYVALALVATHGAAYQWLEGRRADLIVLFSGVLVAAVALQVAGFLRVRGRRHPEM
jgi:sulfoxide reductase heme-binding subunit YedZ